MDGITDTDRGPYLLLELEHRQSGPLDHALAKQPLDQAVGQHGRHELPLDGALLGTERAVDEDGLQHAGHAGEEDQVGLGDGAIEGAKPLPGRQLLPGEA